MADSKKSNRPDRIGRVLVGTHVDQGYAKDFQLYARIEGKTGASLLNDFVRTYVDEKKSMGFGESVSKLRQSSQKETSVKIEKIAPESFPN